MNVSVRSIRLRGYLKAALLLALGCAIGFMLRDLTRGKPQPTHVELRQPGFEFINPLLDCEQAASELQNDELRPIKGTVEDFINNRLDKKWADTVSVYFRELNDGLWFATGDANEYHPASLLKVPLMMAVLKQAETEPSLLAKKIRTDDRILQTIANPVTKSLKLGNAYSVDELLYHMIVYSDNVATYLLDNVVDITILSRTYRDLGLSNPYYRFSSPPVVMASPGYMISADAYASFFRILFNASYLSKTMSEKALSLLSATDFREGLVAGVPPDIKIAHKWGTHLSGEHREIK